VRERQVDGKRVGVIRYSGYANKQNVQQKLGELLSLLRKVRG
jgi:aromatic ring hydroxylase